MSKKWIEIFKIDHVEYAVKRIYRDLSEFEKLGFVLEPVIDDINRNAKLLSGENDGFWIDLVCTLHKM